MSSIKTWLLKKLAAGGESQELLQTIASLEEKVQRYRETDKKRRILHRKLKDRLKEEKREGLRIKMEHRQDKKLLASVTEELNSAMQVLNNFSPILPRLADGAPHNKDDSPWRMTPQRARLEHRAWRPSMRLGVLHQHAPRPFSVPSPPRRLLSGSPPLISIVTPSWQQAEYLGATMASVLDQGYPNLEYIVMDGGSTDGSREIIAGHASRLAHWQSEKDGGQSNAIKSGFNRTTGDIMAWLNSDDLYTPGALAYVAHYFERHPGVDAVYGHRALINEAGHEIGRWYLPPHDASMLLWGDYIPQETWFFRRRIYEKCGGLDPSKRFAMDWDMLLRMQRSGAVFHRLPEFLGCFRVHGAQKSQAIIHDVGAEEIGNLRMRELGLHFTAAELARRSTLFQLRALRAKRLWELGIRSVKW